MIEAERVAVRLATLYEQGFGGKPRGRYRISSKFLRQLADRRRLFEQDIEHIGRALYELGYTMIDLETYYVVLSHKTFASYRRVNEDALLEPGKQD